MGILQELAVNHPYYCSDSNYYSNAPAENYDTMSDFLDDFEGMDIDLNLCFRWDISQKTDEETEELADGYRADVFLILQRKGIFKPCSISSISEEEAIRFKAYASRHLETLKKMWAPIF